MGRKYDMLWNQFKLSDTCTQVFIRWAILKSLYPSHPHLVGNLYQIYSSNLLYKQNPAFLLHCYGPPGFMAIIRTLWHLKEHFHSLPSLVGPLDSFVTKRKAGPVGTRKKRGLIDQRRPFFPLRESAEKAGHWPKHAYSSPRMESDEKKCNKLEKRVTVAIPSLKFESIALTLMFHWKFILFSKDDYKAPVIIIIQNQWELDES